MKNQVLLNKICIRIHLAPDPVSNQLSGSGPCKTVRILSDPDPQHWNLYQYFLLGSGSIKQKERQNITDD